MIKRKVLSRISTINEAKKFKMEAEKITDREKLEEYIHSYGFIVKDVDLSDGFGHDYDGY